MAKEASLTRIDVLSKPKSLPDGFIEDKRSVYWDCKIAKDWTKPPSATTAKLSPRLEQLIQPKTLPKEYVGDSFIGLMIIQIRKGDPERKVQTGLYTVVPCKAPVSKKAEQLEYKINGDELPDIPNPIWQVSPAAMKTSPTARLEALSSSKTLPKDYQPPRSVFSIVSKAAKSANASQRTEVLARPKNTVDLPTNQNLWEWSEWESSVSRAAITASPSDQVLRLAVPRKTHGGYKECREVQWTISDSTLKALPSLRIQQLARPKSRSQFMDHYNENAYKVSSAAKHAQATPRTQELCVPLPRKVKQKKVVS